MVTTVEITEENKDKKDPSEEHLPPRKIVNRDHIVQITAVEFEHLKGMISSNQRGAFRHTSAKGSMYEMVIEVSNASPILATFVAVYNTLKNAGINPVLHINDNEFSTDLIDEIESRGLTYLITPVGNHCTLSAERAIQTFKDHFEPILY